jgi:hypothetical protein
VQYFNGPVTFGFTVQDAHGAYAAAANTATINVAAVNNTPSIDSPQAMYAYSGGGADGLGKLLTGIQFTDVDSGTSDVTVTLSIAGGATLVASTQSGVVVDTSADGHTLTLTGSIQNINNLVYRTEGVQYTAQQGGVRVIPSEMVNPTRNAIPTMLPDGRMSLVVTSTGGVLRADESRIPFDGTGVPLITVTGQNTSTLTLVGPQGEVEKYFNTIQGVVNAGVVYLSTTLNDHGNTGMDPGYSGSSTDELDVADTAIVIQPLNERPKPNLLRQDPIAAAGFGAGVVAGDEGAIEMTAAAETTAEDAPLVRQRIPHGRGDGGGPRGGGGGGGAAPVGGGAVAGGGMSVFEAVLWFLGLVGSGATAGYAIYTSFQPDPPPNNVQNTEPLITNPAEISVIEDTPVKLQGLSIARLTARSKSHSP